MTDRIESRADYERLRDRFEWECPEFFNFGFDVVDRWAEKAGAALIPLFRRAGVPLFEHDDAAANGVSNDHKTFPDDDEDGEDKPPPPESVIWRRKR